MYEENEITRYWPEWNVVEKLGTGSFGSVYKCCKTQYGVDVYSAIKVITIEQDFDDDSTVLLDDEQTIHRYYKQYVDGYLDEIRIMSDIKGCANVVSVEDFRVFEHEDGRGWTILIRMELLNSFSSFMRRHSFTETEAIKLGIDICNALQSCNAYSIIHRDIKPANILMTKDGTYKLSDFGIARKLEGTRYGMSSKGTRSYIAPEVFMGKSYNESVDVYSLGILLYQLMNKNRLPFLNAESGAITHQDMQNALDMRLQDATYTFPCNASFEFGKIILKACEFDPAARYASAAEMKKDLENLLLGIVNPPPPPPPPPWEKTSEEQPPVSKRPEWKKVLSAVGIVCAILVPIVVFLCFSQNKTNADTDALAGNQNASMQGATTVNAESMTESSALEAAIALFEDKKYEESLAAFKTLAEQGNTEAQYYYGFSLHEALGCDEDAVAALHWIKQAAESNHAKAQYVLACIYSGARGTHMDNSKAFELAKKSADQECVYAQALLAGFYYRGTGTQENKELANELWALSEDALIALANEGDMIAQNDLAVAYAEGRGVEQNDEAAEQYYKKSIDSGSLTAISNLAFLYLENGDNENAFKYAQMCAQRGGMCGQYLLGICYNNGFGVTQSFEKAFECYNKALEQKYYFAQAEVAISYLFGSGIEQSDETGIQLLQDSADRGYVNGQFYLGYCYDSGTGIAQSYAKAVEWYQKAADQGNAIAQNDLGNCYYSGEGVTQSYAKAVEWYQKAADQGNAFAQNNLGNCYYSGKGVTQSYEKAVEWYQKAADQGNAFAQNNLGNCYYSGNGVTQAYAKAVEWYQKAADQGYADAQANLAYCYENGNGVTQSYAKAVEWYQKAADQGYADAQYKLGVCYANGNGVTQSYAKAVEWYQKAADQGNAASQNSLGYCYKNGNGVTQSYEKAVEWYQKAADQGYAAAQWNLGVCYLEGKGVTANRSKAIALFEQAAANGQTNAIEWLEKNT